MTITRNEVKHLADKMMTAVTPDTEELWAVISKNVVKGVTTIKLTATYTDGTSETIEVPLEVRS